MNVGEFLLQLVLLAAEDAKLVRGWWYAQYRYFEFCDKDNTKICFAAPMRFVYEGIYDRHEGLVA